MKLITFSAPGGPRPGVALDESTGLDLLALDPALPRWNELFAVMDRVRALAAPWLDGGGTGDEGARVTLADRLLPPVPEPSKIIAVGRNYRAHAAEQNREAPTAPLLFAKAPSCLQAHGGPIELEPELAQVDAEAELAVIVGRRGRGIAREDAAAHIAGYTCFNDISDREAQFGDKQWFRGKSLDTGGPCGPWITTPDELPPLARGLRIVGRLNGEIMQDSDTSELIFPVDELICYASRTMTLMPGDIIATGTPSGVGVFRDPPVFLKPGDVSEVSIEGIGTLTNPVVLR